MTSPLAPLPAGTPPSSLGRARGVAATYSRTRSTSGRSRSRAGAGRSSRSSYTASRPGRCASRIPPPPPSSRSGAIGTEVRRETLSRQPEPHLAPTYPDTGRIVLEHPMHDYALVCTYGMDIDSSDCPGDDAKIAWRKADIVERTVFDVELR